MADSKAKLKELARKDNERIMLEEAKNKFEAYIYEIKNKFADNEEAIGSISTQSQREALLKSADDAAEWMDDEGYDAGLEQFEKKYKELYDPAEKIFFRLKENDARPAAVSALREKLGKVEDLMKKWEETMPQVTAEERTEVLDLVEEVRKWILEKEQAQAVADPASDPVFKSEEVPLQTKKIEALVGKLNRKPKPKKEDTKNATDSQSNATNTDEKNNSETVEESTGEAPSSDELNSEEKAAEDEL